jgi:vacuolar-type H+-ATPase subunit H
MPSKDILDKLFGVERQAEALIDEASIEASRRVSAAKEAAEIAFKASYEASVKTAEKDRMAAEAAADAEHGSVIAEYKARLEGSHLDREAFSEACERFVPGMD